MIKILEENILNSFLEDFRDKYVDDNSHFDEFKESLFKLIGNDQKLSNMINSIDANNKSLEDYIKDLRIKLNNDINHNQKLLEQYNQLLTDNKRLSTINNIKNDENSTLTDNLNDYERKIADLDVQIASINKDISYYKNLLENISLITNILNNKSFKLDDAYNFTSINNSPYYRIIEESGQFDKNYYVNKYLTIDNYYNDDINPIEHFIKIGSNLDYNPNAEFNTKWYRNYYLNGDYNLNPFVDYLTYGKKYERLAHLSYNKKEEVFIEDTHEYLLKDEISAFEDEVNPDDDQLHIILDESKLLDNMNYAGNDLGMIYGKVYDYYMDKFDENFDYSKEPDLDILDSIEYTLLLEDELFDKDYYLNTYSDVKNAGVDPIVHYLRSGYKENRSPSEGFNTKRYLLNHPNIKINPLVCHIYQNKIDITEDIITTDTIDTQEYAILSNPEFFDKNYYLRVYSDVKNSNVDALTHFIINGIKEHRNPKESINIDALTTQVPDNGHNKYVEYVLDKCMGLNTYDITQKVHDDEYKRNYKLLKNSIYFDEKYYAKHNPNITSPDEAIDYYLTKGFKEEYPTSIYFSPENYLNLNQDLKSHDINPLIHFINSGIKEKRPFKRPKLSYDELDDDDKLLYKQYTTIYDSRLFDERYYLEKNPKLLETGENPIIHYLKYGVELSLNPSELFSTQLYLKKHGDIKRTGFNPLYHYLTNGIKENRFIFMPAENYPNKFLECYDYLTTQNMLQVLKNNINIIIKYDEDNKIFNKVIQNILENTENSYTLYILADKKDELLDSLDSIANIHVVNDKSITSLIKTLTDDFVILDNNTLVTPHWLSKLSYSAYTNNHVATVSALTNTSHMLKDESQKILNEAYNINDDNHKLNDLSKKMEIIFNNNYTECIISDANCLYVKIDTLKDITFNNIIDMQIALYENNWISLINNSVYAYDNKKSPNKLSKDIIDKYDLNNTFYNKIEVKKINKIIKERQFNNNYKKRLLVFTQVTDDEVKLDEKLRKLSNFYDTYVLAIDMDKYYIYKYEKGILSLLDNSKVDYSFTRNYYFKTFFNMLINLKIDAVYTKTFKQLYHPTNRNFNHFIEFLPYLEIEELHESVYEDVDIIGYLNNKFYPQNDFETLMEKHEKRIDFKDKKVAVYTAVTGSYDEPIIPSYVNENFDYICFTDNPNLKSDFWTIKQMEKTGLDKIRKVRMYKILPHKYLSEYDYSLWIDTNFEITGNIIDYINKYQSDNKLLAIKHEYRDCIYDEAKTCINSNKDSEDTIKNQIAQYKKEEYPTHNGLIASGILFRKHNDKKIIKIMEDWFEQLETYSYRDQLSFNYACWKNNYKYDEAKVFYLKNSYFQRHDHLKNGYILRTNKVDYAKDYDLQYEIDDINNIMDAFKQKTSIIIEANDTRHTNQLIKSIKDNTNIDYEIILINNNNNPEINKIQEKYNDINIKIITNKEKQSYPTNINMAIKESSNDIVILDNNTIVTPKWLEKLKIKAYSNEEFGSVTCLTNNDRHYKLEIEDDYLLNNVNTIANNIEKKSKNNSLIIPSTDKMCTYIKKEVIYKTGFFDNRFEDGYCSDIDYSRRLKNRGYNNVLDTQTFIYSHKEKTETENDNKKIINMQYPDYKRLDEEYKNSIELKEEIQHINYGLKTKNNSKKRILYAIHGGAGGTLHTSIELMRDIDKSIETFLLVTDTEKVELYKYTPNTQEDNLDEEEFKNNINLLRTWKLKSTYTQENRSMDNLKQIYFNLLVYLHIDIIHIRHLIKSTLDLPQIAQRLKIPVILSFHDFYYICPSHNLIDDNRRYCAGICPPLYEKSALGGQCNIVGQLNIPPARLTVHKWRDDIRKLFKNITAFVTTSKSTYDLYTKFYPELKEKDFRIIEHGRDVKTPQTTKYINKLDANKIKIVFPGHLSYTKGYELIKAIKKLDVDNRLEYHYMGSLGGHDDLKDIGIDHGTYNRSDFNRIIHEIKPHFIGIFTICPETYCHTLTEGLGSGIPIIGVNLGAVGERIKRDGGGYLIENNPQKAYEDIIRYAEDEAEYLKKAEEITKIKFKTTEQMSNEYLEIYEKYMKN